MTSLWTLLFYGSLVLLLVLVLGKSLRLSVITDRLHNLEASSKKWFHPTLTKESEQYISLAIIGKFISFALFVIVTIIEEVLHRIIHGLKRVTSLLIQWIDSYERKHHHPSGTTSRMAQLRSILDNPQSDKKNSSQN